jgi:SAM-dependent methyltransferase
MPESRFDEWIAERYEALWPELFEPSVLEPAVEFLATLVGTGAALEFGIGTGRVALPLSQRGIRVHGIDLSPAMVAQLRTRPGGSDIAATVGDFATTRVSGRFRLVFLLRNTITNLANQAEQLEAFRNAARHLVPGGRFVIENYVPELRRLPPGETTYLFAATETHVGYEQYDVANQLAVSHHCWLIDGNLMQFESLHRYVWPAELDLMAHIAGLTLKDRWGDWNREPFTSESRSHISVWGTTP